MLKIQKEKEKKREAEKADDYLRQVDKLGSDFVVADIEKDRKKAKKKADAFLTSLGQKKLYRFTYRSSLAKNLQNKVSEIDFPDGWEYKAIPTDGKRQIRVYGKYFDTKQGVVLILKSPKGEVFIRAVQTCYRPEVDFKSMNILAVQAENTVDSAKGILLSDKKTKSGIYLP